jgi:hypothetical protein
MGHGAVIRCNEATTEGDVELLPHRYEALHIESFNPGYEGTVAGGIAFWAIIIFIILVISYPGLFLQILFHSDIGPWFLASLLFCVTAILASCFIMNRGEKIVAPDSPDQRPTSLRMTQTLRFSPKRGVSNFCYECGRALEPTSRFCKECGARVR